MDKTKSDFLTMVRRRGELALSSAIVQPPPDPFHPFHTLHEALGQKIRASDSRHLFAFKRGNGGDLDNEQIPLAPGVAEFLDDLPHSDVEDYIETMKRLRQLDVAAIYMVTVEDGVFGVVAKTLDVVVALS